jgi:RIO kinase 1
MTTHHNFELYEQIEDMENLPHIRNVPVDVLHAKSHPKRHKVPPNELAELSEGENDLHFSYHAAKHEKAWLIDSLEAFYGQQWFDDILRLIKGGGKEASVYQCLANATIGATYLAAKVYRPRKFRQLRNDSLYREGRDHLDDEGRKITDGGALHAIHKRTTIGMRMLHTSWIEHEFQTLSLLHDAGAAVPKPYASGNNAILMEYIGWDDLPAPTLNTVNLSTKEARRVFQGVLENVEIMLANQRVHGDLSAYNILYFEGEICLIDFPQAIEPGVNRNAYAIFQRDIIRLCEPFQAQGVTCDPHRLAEDLWQRHGYPIKSPIDPRLIASDHLLAE